MPVPVEVFLSNRDLWAPVACLLAILAGLSFPLSARTAALFRADRLTTLGSLLCLAVVAAFTLPTRLSSHGPVSCTVAGLPETVSVTDPQNFLNVLLYVPPAFLGVLVTRRLSWVVAGLAATSVSIEFAQLLSDRRDCNTADMIFNILGAVAGAGAAVVLLRRRSVRGGKRPVPDGSRPDQTPNGAG
ncbi:VanZ family protein [Streptosporangium sp. NPDC051022]|uniref:VanZ family protein n=1 Tax=Streptosporangium sp. NPDC051022 TaxID=3155752 RepID=UPI00342D2C20